MEFQEQKFTEARVVSEAVSSVRSAWFSGQNYRIRTSIKGLEWSEDQDHKQDQDQEQGAFYSGKAIIDCWVW